ncbi:MAG: molybdopterin-dependent oxidoreductase [Hyphomicrobiaceae bacterium]|nr:molybdopterin-dependent oxidoreductase [Hyphomicrobiaceae bacterium]
MQNIRVTCAHDCPCMCSLIATVDNGRLVKVAGDPEQPYTDGFACAKVNRDAELVYAPDRIKTPLRRTGAKGSGSFAAITWGEALNEIESRFKGIIAKDGPLALLGYAYSAHQGQINRHSVNGLFHALGTSRLTAGTVCDSCCETAWDLTLGPVGGADPESVAESDLIISWGCDLKAVNVHFWQKAERRQKQGVKIIVIDPRRTRTAQSADWHIPIRIGTDAALALGVVHILVRDGKCDEDYIARNVLGFDQWKREIIPQFPPARVAEITGLSVTDVERLADLYGTAKRSFIRIGEGMTRLARGGQALRAVATLPAITGAYGRRGGGALLLAAGSMDFNFAPIRKPSGPAATRQVNHSLLGEALLTLADPPINGLLICANNPAVTNPDVAKVKQALSREDLFTVVHDPMLTDTARYADIVLPATTYLETEDFYRGYGSYYMQFAPAAIPPQGEAWSNLRLAQELARRLGVTDPVFSMSPREIFPRFFEGATGAVAKVDPARLLEHRAIKVAPETEGQEFRTRSGKLEIYAADLARDGVPPMPVWEPDPQEQADAARWPLRLLTTPGYFQSHTAFSANAFLREREGEPCCVLHPAEAARRGLADNAVVRLFNERGAIGLKLRISDEIQEGVVLVPGQRPEREAVSGTVNVLCSDRLSDIGAGATYQSTFLEVEAWKAGAVAAE